MRNSNQASNTSNYTAKNEAKRYSSSTNTSIGNTALKLDHQSYAPQQETGMRVTKAQKRNSLKRRLKEERAKVNLLCTFVNGFVIIATLVVCVVFLRTQYMYHELGQEIEMKKQELSVLVKENAVLQEEIKSQVNLETIYLEATTRLGMKLPGTGDVYTIHVEPLTYTTKLATVEVKEDKTTLGNVLGYVTRGW